ncbi:MAG: CehA/McbA family metallohydrolase [Gemmataceae bacterium]|nr:CehA/McbA family metallohydrolase [Gemmataceae bacterium]
MLALHLRINDAATGKPTPVRLRISGTDGSAFPPLGRFADFPTGRNEAVGGHLMLGREAWWYVDGSCEVRLPAGVPLRVRAAKGPEYAPLDEPVTLGPGQMALRFTMTRTSDVRAEGWVPGDTRCHFLTPHAALLEGAAEDLDVVNLLACAQDFPSIHDGTAYPTAPQLDAFSGQRPALEAEGRVVVVNTLNAHPALGKVGLLNAHRPVYPLAFGGDEPDDWSVSDWCDQCHRKGGLAVWVDAFRPAGGLVGGEALVAAILGKIDAIEVDPAPRPQPLLPWVYRLWNAGFPVPLAGGSGKDSNRVAVGAVRTYARLTPGEAPRYRVWIEAVRAGRTVVTDGPFLSLDVAGRGPGEVVDATGEVRVRAAVRSAQVPGAIEIVHNGSVVAARSGEVEAIIPAEPGWIAARYAGPGVAGFAHTSPALLRPGGIPLPRHPDAAARLARLVAETRDWVERVGRFEMPRAKDHLLGLCDVAAARLAAG